jgi:hypothetical protein
MRDLRIPHQYRPAEYAIWWAKYEADLLALEMLTGKSLTELDAQFQEWASRLPISRDDAMARCKEAAQRGDPLPWECDTAQPQLPTEAQVNSLKCPTDNGGCGADDSWRVALDRDNRRVILDCARCSYRISLPLVVAGLSESFTGPLDERGVAVLC